MKCSPTIIESLTNPSLFGRYYAGPTWRSWHIVGKTATGMPLDDEELGFFREVSGGRSPPGRRVKTLALAIARRGGKDSFVAGFAAHTAVSYRPSDRVRAGERPMVLLLGADRSQAQNLLRYIRALFDVPELEAMIESETQWGFSLKNKVDIVVGTADWRTSARGRTILLAVCNEVCFWQSEGSSNPDHEIISALKPAMMTLPESMLIMISSVHRRAGVLYDTYERYFGNNDQNTLVLLGTSRQFNPLIDQATVDAALAEDPQVASAELLSIWRDDLSGYLTRDEIMAVVDKGIAVRAPQSGGVQYQAHLDASSGQGKDSLACAIGHKAGDISIIDCVIEIAPPFKPSDAIFRIATCLRSYGISRVTCDRWGLGFVEQELQRHNITTDYSDKNSSELFRQALPIITSQRCRLVEHERAITQFANLERRAMPGGGERISHPNRSGFHDDVAVTIAGCLVTLSQELIGATAWLEYMRRECVKAGVSFNRNGVDMDPFRPAGPAFGFDLNPAPLVSIKVPSPIAAEGRLPRTRRIGTQVVAEMTRREAAGWLSNPVWRSLNPELVRELGMNDDTVRMNGITDH
jgi:hypothetical protein